MYIILKIIKDEVKEVLNIVYGDDINLAYTWVTDTLSNEIKEYTNTKKEDEHDIKYIVEFDNNVTYILKKIYKRLREGYVYNSYSKKEIELYKIRIIKFTGESTMLCTKSILYNNLNTEINNRVIYSLDKESMYQIFRKVQNVITTKSSWNYTEYNTILTEVLKTFKKDFYSSIAKRAKKYGKF
jgi:hypothetical protein